MVNPKRGKPQKWSDEDLKQFALEIKYKQPNRKLTSLLLEKETGIGRNTWSRRMKEFIDQLNSPVHIPKLDESGIITIPSVEELFLKYGTNTIELKNEIAKLLNIISDLYTDAKQLQTLKEPTHKMQLEMDQLKEKLSKTTDQKVHLETLYNQIVAESYFPHLFGRSEKLKQANVKAEIIPLPVQKTKTLELDTPFNIFQNELNLKSKQETNISELNKMFNLDIE
jgi:regulator of replication initiation timing